MKIRALLVAMSVATVLTGCQNMDSNGLLSSGAEAFQAYSLSDAQVKALSDQACQEMDSKATIAPANSEYAKRLTTIANALGNNINGQPVNYKVYMAKDVNAFAMANGCIRVYSGLMDMMTDNEVEAVIGHEMSHGYDDQGARFGPTGNFEDWWTPADASAFKSLTGKLVQQFDAYKTDAGGQISGNLTLGENIADLGGLATAYDAMKKATDGTPDPMTDGLTRDQRFFLNWATVWRRNFTPEELAVRLKTDSHAPANFRAIGAPSNLPAFAAAFKCKVGDAMVRAADKQVVIW